MSRDNGQSDGVPVPFFSLQGPDEELDDTVDLETYELDYPQVSFEKSLEAIQADAMAPQDVLGFSNMSLKNIHELRSVWTKLSQEARETIAEIVLSVSSDHMLTDFGRFFLVLLEDSSDSVRLAAARGAVQSEETSLIAPLVALAESEASVTLREAAIRGLAQSVIILDFEGSAIDRKDFQRLQRLKSWAQNPGLPDVLRAAALETWSFYTLDDDTVGLIESFVESDSDELQLGAMKAMVQAGSGDFTRFLETQLQSSDSDRREAAAYAMGMSTDEAVVPMLTMLAREDAEPAVREAAYAALGNQGSKSAVRSLETLRQHASDDDIDLIDAALQYAAEMEELDDMSMFAFEEDDEDDEDY